MYPPTLILALILTLILVCEPNAVQLPGTPFGDVTIWNNGDLLIYTQVYWARILGASEATEPQ